MLYQLSYEIYLNLVNLQYILFLSSGTYQIEMCVKLVIHSDIFLIFRFHKWYFFTKIVLTYCEKKCSSDQEKLLKFEAEGREFAKFLRSVEQFIQTVTGQNSFWKQNAFLTFSWRFLIPNKLEQL